MALSLAQASFSLHRRHLLRSRQQHRLRLSRPSFQHYRNSPSRELQATHSPWLDCASMKPSCPSNNSLPCKPPAIATKMETGLVQAAFLACSAQLPRSMLLVNMCLCHRACWLTTMASTKISSISNSPMAQTNPSSAIKRTFTKASARLPSLAWRATRFLTCHAL